MGSAVLLWDDFDGAPLRQRALQTKDPTRPGECWRSPRFTTAIPDYRVSVSPPTLGGELRSRGYRKLSARPKHYVITRRSRKRSKSLKPTRRGGKIWVRPASVRRTRSRRWAKRGTRPSARPRCRSAPHPCASRQSHCTRSTSRQRTTPSR